jgi:trk system potassium uptake protein TrkA
MLREILGLWRSNGQSYKHQEQTTEQMLVRTTEHSNGQTQVTPKTTNGSARKPHKRRGSREFIVIGLGRFGRSLAKSLVEHKHDVLAIDSDYNLVQMLSTDLPHVLQIDATNIDALREIGAEHFDTAVVCIGEDFESNLLATVHLHQLGVRRVIAKARTRTQRDILLQIGADEVILPEHEAGCRLAQRLSSHGFVDYLQLGPEMGVVEMLAPEHLHGQTLADADLRREYGLTVLAIRHDGQFAFNLPAETRVQEGDELLVVGNITEAERLCS